MTDPREELQDIQERADNATGCPASETDVPRLVAALRAVLDLADWADSAASQVMTYGVPSGMVSTINLRRVISERLGGTQ